MVWKERQLPEDKLASAGQTFTVGCTPPPLQRGYLVLLRLEGPADGDDRDADAAHDAEPGAARRLNKESIDCRCQGCNLDTRIRCQGGTLP